VALDIEPTMRSETQRRCTAFANRLNTAPFAMERSDWYAHLDGADVVVSSLCVHHLDGEQKRALFRAIAEHTSGRGALLIADLVLHKRAQSRSLFAATWDQSAREAADAQGSSAFSLFEAEHWNYYHYPDDFDKPSPLSDQLVWLTQAGFHDVDCFWLSAGHAIYGGYGVRAGQDGIAYEDALRAAQTVFSQTGAQA
jgi:tRNA (cmo5U34)-methyltransferase